MRTVKNGIKEIARITGYSTSTVARALSGNGYCGAEKKEKILSIAKQLNYQSNSSAIALRSGCTKRILFCIPDICNIFYFKMIQGVIEVLENNGYYAMLYTTEKKLDKEIHMIRLLKQKFCDGMIMVSFDFCKENISAIRESGCPVVLTNKYDGQKPGDNFDYIFVDHTYGMALATEHLLAAGCKNIAVVSGDVREQTTRERLDGYIGALKKHGLEYDASRVLDGQYNNDGAYAAFRAFTEEGGRADGLIVSNDYAAMGILRFCHERGIRIPEDLKLVSFDNTDYALACVPTLTSVDMRQYEIGKYAAEVLLERIQGRKEIRNVVMMPKLIERQSS